MVTPQWKFCAQRRQQKGRRQVTGAFTPSTSSSPRSKLLRMEIPKLWLIKSHALVDVAIPCLWENNIPSLVVAAETVLAADMAVEMG
ncbi:hypothetical protein Lal_00028442 [Lupinus albus]|nr:hypothetical protein Lal_00028442 [Lupinus albus]